MRRFIVGQDSTSMPIKEGLGSRVSKVQENTFFRLVNLDCINLEDTITDELIAVLQEYNFPKARYKCKYKINMEKPEPSEWLKAAQIFLQMGGTIIESEARSILGFTAPQLGDEVLGGMVSELPTSDKAKTDSEEALDK